MERQGLQPIAREGAWPNSGEVAERFSMGSLGRQWEAAASEWAR
jgi:hypothetical protein